MISPPETGPLGSEKIVHQVKLQLADGSIVAGEITEGATYQTKDHEWAYRLKLEAAGVGSFLIESPDDYFEAMIELRRRLEPMGVKLLCFGARRDTFVSGMGRDMGGGLKAYLLSAPVKGRPPLQSIFDYAPPETIATVDEQQAYYDEWLA